MSELRWAILGIGVVVMLAVWALGRKRPPRREPLGENLMDAVRDDDLPELTDVAEPGLDLEEIEALGRSLQREVRDDDDRADRPQMILAIHVARPARPIEAMELFPALDAAGLSYGQMDIFHYELEDGQEAFSVANMVEPGTFDPTTMIEGISTPGVTMFAVLPGPLSAVDTLQYMTGCARELAKALGAEVLDEGRGALGKQAENALREKAAAFDAQMRRFRGDGD